MTAPTIHDAAKLVSEHFGMTMNQAAALFRTPLHPATLRDEFAGRALQGMLAQSCGMAAGNDPKHAAEYAYMAADAMLAARAPR